MAELKTKKTSAWGSSIVGFGGYQYKYASGRQGEWFQVGFAPRKGNLTLYMMGGFDGGGKLLERLGKHRIGKACLYIKRLEDVDLGVLEKMIDATVKRKSGPGSSSGC